jgi:phosphoenolpyruvate carboxykinase (ATP)
MSEADFDRLQGRIVAFLRDKALYVQDLFAGANACYRFPVRVITQYAWHSLFARQLLVRPDLYPDRGAGVTIDADRGFTIISAPGCKAVPAEDHTCSEAFVAVHFGKRMVLIGGTEYAGEIKKSVFTVLNYILPMDGVLPMHCSANIGRHHGDTALFFGLSGTGKTTLSADPTRQLIGDDEHGWSDSGVFNFEGGCYAKCIRLSEDAEPQIWRAIRYGAVLENVVMDPVTRKLDYDSEALTENTRAAYPVDFIPDARIPGVGGQPQNVLFLTADAFGVLPPISRLTNAQARFHFLSGYTAKVAGTERGLGDEPEATFSACFGMPFLPLNPTVYSKMLGDRLDAGGAAVWLVNTGWSGGPYGVGRRMNIHHTRAMVDAAVEGLLDDVEFRVDPVFGLQVPIAVPDVPTQVLNPRDTWTDGAAYDAQARNLARRFAANFEKFRADATPEVVELASKL